MAYLNTCANRVSDIRPQLLDLFKFEIHLDFSSRVEFKKQAKVSKIFLLIICISGFMVAAESIIKVLLKP